MTFLHTPFTVLTTSVALAALGSIGATARPAVATPVSACGNSSLKVSHTPARAATGHGSFVLLFRNTSNRTCTIRGYPGLDALNASGHPLARARRTLRGFAGGAHVERTVTLRPNQYGSATVEWLNFNPVTSGTCTFSKSVATTAANTTHAVRLAVSVSLCRLQVHPTVAGTSGNN